MSKDKKKINKYLESLDVQTVRKMLFTPCQSRKELENWMLLFLDLPLPNCTVDARSTSNPMENVWEIYEKALKNDDPDFNSVLSYASRDSFKCSKKGTLILSKDNGLIPIEKIKIGETIWSGKSWRQVTDWIHDGVKESVTLETDNGATLTVSPIHRVWAWSPGELPSWKRVADLSSKDIVRWDTESTWSDGTIDQKEYDIGYLCGILTGDGCLTLMNTHNRISLSGIDSYVIGFWNNACLKYGGKRPTQSKSRPCDWFINSVSFCNEMKKLGLTDAHSWDKKLPARCMENPSVLIGFLSGLFDTDGSVDRSKNNILFAMTAEGLLRQLQIALCAIGIDSQYKSNKLYPQFGQKHRVHILNINQNTIPKLFKAGFKISAKKAATFQIAKTLDAHDGIPKNQLGALLNRLPKKGGRWKPKVKNAKPSTTYPTITRGKVEDLIQYGIDNNHLNESDVLFWKEINKTRWVKVRSIKNDIADFYDLTVDIDHSYWSDGYVSHNTLGASVLELLMLLHLERSLAHMAAVETQAIKAQSYVKGFLRRPFLKDFVISNAKRRIEVVKYRNLFDDTILSLDEWKLLPKHKQDKYEERMNYATIVVCTMQSTNSEHVSYMCVDEIDVVTNPLAYEESKMIPAPFEGKMPITLLTSTRKFSFGLVQKEIDNASTSGLQIRRWNIIDVSQACKAERHLPLLPKIPIYYSEETLKSVPEEEFKAYDEEKQKKYQMEEGYQGCLSNCKLYAMCRGRLATEQKSTSPLLKDINYVQNQFKRIEAETAKAQLLCWKPSSEGMIFGRIEHDKHVISAAEMAYLVTGENYSLSFSKQQLIELFKKNDRIKWYCGMDFGYTHAFAVVLMAVFGNKTFVIDSYEIPELELQEQIGFCDIKIKSFSPEIYADTAYPAYIKTFSRHGYKMRSWKKGPGSVLTGISAIRSKLAPVIGDPELFLLKNDEGCEALYKDLAAYHWTLDVAGNPTDVPSEDGDDKIDALRYAIMNVFSQRGRVLASHGENVAFEETKKGPMQQFIEEALADAPSLETTGKKGRLGWSF